MARYRCDFGQVRSIGEELCHSADDLKSAVNTYSSKIESDLSSWSGSAKNEFASKNQEQVNTSTADAEYMRALGEFIKEAADEIEKLEGDLAGLSI